jgi:hypothetical protein
MPSTFGKKICTIVVVRCPQRIPERSHRAAVMADSEQALTLGLFRL